MTKYKLIYQNFYESINNSRISQLWILKRLWFPFLMNYPTNHSNDILLGVVKIFFSFSSVSLAWDLKTRSCPLQLPALQLQLSFSFSPFLPLSRCRAKVQKQFPIPRATDRRQRETAHEILRDTEIYARARSSSFDQDPRKSPVPVPRGKMDHELDATLYRFNILFPPTGPPLGSSHLPSLRAISIPYLALFRFFTVRSYLMYDTPLRRRPNRTNTRLVFGTDHSPLSLPGSVLGPRVARVYVVHVLFRPERYVFVPRMKKNSP